MRRRSARAPRAKAWSWPARISPPPVHALAYLMNAALGNIGRTVDIRRGRTVGRGDDPAAGATAIKAGAVKTLFILGGNPAYNAPGGPRLGGAAEIGARGHPLRLLRRRDLGAGRGARRRHALPRVVGRCPHGRRHHRAGPADDPAAVRRDDRDRGAGPRSRASRPPTRTRWSTQHDHRARRRRSGEDLPAVPPRRPARRTRPSRRSVRLRAARRRGRRDSRRRARSRRRSDAQSLEVRFVADHKVDDGRFANNGWLQECPDPITQTHLGQRHPGQPAPGARSSASLPASAGCCRWPATRPPIGSRARRWRTSPRSSWAAARSAARCTSSPAWPTTRSSCRSATAARRRAGSATGAGFSAYALRTSDAPHIATGATIELVTGERQAPRQHPGALVDGGPRHRPRGQRRRVHATTRPSSPRSAWSRTARLYDPASARRCRRRRRRPRSRAAIRSTQTPKFDGRAPVGHVASTSTPASAATPASSPARRRTTSRSSAGTRSLRGREMHWIRIDRYYSDGRHRRRRPSAARATARFPRIRRFRSQPMACQQCELAPCEMVCPVNATVHDDEGLNVMAYNRCVGTRYCANNCPTRSAGSIISTGTSARLDACTWARSAPQGMPELVKMVQEPGGHRPHARRDGEVHLLRAADRERQDPAEGEGGAGRPARATSRVPDGAIKTACQQVCPVEAIVFGNLLDPDSAVSQGQGPARRTTRCSATSTPGRARPTSASCAIPNPRMPDYADAAAEPASRHETSARSRPGGRRPRPTPDRREDRS